MAMLVSRSVEFHDVGLFWSCWYWGIEQMDVQLFIMFRTGFNNLSGPIQSNCDDISDDISNNSSMMSFTNICCNLRWYFCWYFHHVFSTTSSQLSFSHAKKSDHLDLPRMQSLPRKVYSRLRFPTQICNNPGCDWHPGPLRGGNIQLDDFFLHRCP